MKLILFLSVFCLINCQMPVGLFQLMNQVQQNFNNQIQMQGKIRRMRGFSRQITRNPDGSVTTVTREFGPEMGETVNQNQSQNNGLQTSNEGISLHLQNQFKANNDNSFKGNQQENQLKSLFDFDNSPIKIIRIGKINEIGQQKDNNQKNDKQVDMFQETDKIMQNSFRMSNSISNVLGNMVKDLVNDIEREQEKDELQKEKIEKEKIEKEKIEKEKIEKEKIEKEKKEKYNKKEKKVNEKLNKGVDSLLDQIDKQLLNGKKNQIEKVQNKEIKEFKNQEKPQENINKVDYSIINKEQKNNIEWIVNKQNLENINQKAIEEQRLIEKNEVKENNQKTVQSNINENKNDKVLLQESNYGQMYGFSKLPLIFIFVIICISIYISILKKKKQTHNIQNDSNFIRINKSD